MYSLSTQAMQKASFRPDKWSFKSLLSQVDRYLQNNRNPVTESPPQIEQNQEENGRATWRGSRTEYTKHFLSTQQSKCLTSSNTQAVFPTKWTKFISRLLPSRLFPPRRDLQKKAQKSKKSNTSSRCSIKPPEMIFQQGIYKHSSFSSGKRRHREPSYI